MLPGGCLAGTARGDALREWQDAQAGTDPFRSNYLAQAPFFEPPPGTPDRGWRLPDKITGSRFIAEALVSAHLRSWVDGWLDTGRERNGSESSSWRNLRKADKARQAAAEFIEQSPPRLVLSPDTGDFEVLLERNWRHPWAKDFFTAQIIEAQRLFVGILAGELSTPVENSPLRRSKIPPPQAL